MASEELLAARELRETKAARRLSRRGHLGPGSWRAAALGEPCHPAREACSQRGRRAPANSQTGVGLPGPSLS